MAIDQYTPCPCGSGKKFKWCCLPIHVEIDRAFQQEAEGQHDTALRLLDEVIKAHPDNPEAFGRKAQLLYEHGKPEDAENTLQKAFDLNPNYPFGLLLRGLFRMEEGELKGALLSFRKAADAYDPEAHDYLGRAYTLIAETELKMNRPIAAHAALKLAVRYHPGNEELSKAIEQVFGSQSRLPVVARKDYTFRSSGQLSSKERAEAWGKALSSTQGRLGDAARAFEQIIKEDDKDAPAWFNLGLSRAWLGDNRGALEALDRHVALEEDTAKAAEAWALGEVLRQGVGMDDASDYIEHGTLFQLRAMDALFNVLDEWQRERRFIPFQVNQEQQTITGLILEKRPALTPELAATQVATLGAYLLIVGDHLRLWHTNPEPLAKVREEIASRVQGMNEVRTEQAPASFNDLLADGLGFPMQAPDADKARQLVIDHAQRFFEDKWIHRPLRSLGSIAPVDAAGQPTLRKKVLGVIEFLHDCAATTPLREYDFDRLRRKLGILQGAAAAASTGGPDIGAMGAAELAALAVDTLAEPQLEQAYLAALKLDAREVAGKFAQSLVSRPVAAGQARDRFPWFSHLIQLAVANSDTDTGLNYVNEGEKDDCEHNEGRRRNDYELRRGQLHAKRGDFDAAGDVFDRLIQRVPSELRYPGAATEAMLSARRGDKALHFAEAGLAKAREKNDRDSEQYFLELLEAAKRMKQ